MKKVVAGDVIRFLLVTAYRVRTKCSDSRSNDNNWFPSRRAEIALWLIKEIPILLRIDCFELSIEGIWIAMFKSSGVRPMLFKKAVVSLSVQFPSLRQTKGYLVNISKGKCPLYCWNSGVLGVARTSLSLANGRKSHLQSDSAKSVISNFSF